MTKYNWCHNPDCHTIETQSRIRGTGDNKVLRTVKIKVGRYNWANDNTPQIWDYFCNQNCLFQFLGKRFGWKKIYNQCLIHYGQEIVNQSIKELKQEGKINERV